MSRADWILRRSPFQLIAASFNRERVRVLAFHGVDDPGTFAGQMDYLRRHYHPISMEELDRAVNGGGSIPQQAVLVTFDDGHRSVLDHGVPVLSERGIPAAAFVIAGLLSSTEDFWWSSVVDLVEGGGRLGGHEGSTGEDLVRYLKTVPNDVRIAALAEIENSAGRLPLVRPQLDDDELAVLESAGIAVGNHTWSHPCLNRCDPATIREEIESAHQHLANILGSDPRFFAYPNGDWEPHAETVLEDLGYSLAFLFDHRLVGRTTDHLRLSRLRVNSETPPDRFATIASGLHPFIHNARGRS